MIVLNLISLFDVFLLSHSFDTNPNMCKLTYFYFFLCCYISTTFAQCVRLLGEMRELNGGTINPNRSKPRALFVSKDGSPVLTWNDIEQINMNDLNNALGSFNPGAKPGRGKGYVVNGALF